MKLLRKLLFPFSILYGWVMSLRNWAYENGYLNCTAYDIPIICVGNLSVGGTGKSPMIEFLLDFLKEEYQVAVLSRGYKRKTKGFVEVKETSTAEEVGDEPLQFKRKFPQAKVAVCEDRRKGIEQLQTWADIILLDDAFQHRKVKPSTTILLTPYHDLFINDYMLPTGNLREPRKGAERADIIIVTKCPDRVSYSKLQEIEYRMPLGNLQELFFSKIGYSEVIHGKSEILPLEYLSDKPFTLVTGIANPTPLTKFLADQEFQFTHEKFGDHHHFSNAEIETMKTAAPILTTEKDYMRLKDRMEGVELYYLPITTKILNDQGQYLRKSIQNRIKHTLPD